MKRFCLALDLIDDPKLIREYEQHHENMWPEIEKSIRDSGILQMEIYRVENRLFMIMETTEPFSFDEKSEMDQNNPVVQRWENLMWNYQKALPGSAPGEKWRLMEKIFALHDSE
jgi:L-rhamnose mutarotase